MHAIIGKGVTAKAVALTLAIAAQPPEAPEPTYETFTATAYTADCEGCIGITKTGVDVRNAVEHDGLDGKPRRVIAVDPDVIPLGSDVEIRLADGEVIEATAQDIGGGINGNEIDVLKKTEAKALVFGRQKVGVRVLHDTD